MAGIDLRMRPGGGESRDLDRTVLIGAVVVGGLVIARMAVMPAPTPTPPIDNAAPVYSRTIVRAALPRQPVVIG